MLAASEHCSLRKVYNTFTSLFLHLRYDFNAPRLESYQQSNVSVTLKKKSFHLSSDIFVKPRHFQDRPHGLGSRGFYIEKRNNEWTSSIIRKYIRSVHSCIVSKNVMTFFLCCRVVSVYDLIMSLTIPCQMLWPTEYKLYVKNRYKPEGSALLTAALRYRHFCLSSFITIWLTFWKVVDR